MSGRADDVDAARDLAHLDEALARLGVGDEMEVRELGDRVTDELVDRAGELAPFDVCDQHVVQGPTMAPASASTRSPWTTMRSGGNSRT